MNFQEYTTLLRRVRRARRFPTNTDPASRHAQMIGEHLLRLKPYPMLTEEPQHCGESILCAVAGLFETRTALAELLRVVEMEATSGCPTREYKRAVKAAQKAIA